MNKLFGAGLISGAISLLGLGGALAQLVPPTGPPPGAGGSAADPAALLSMPIPTIFTSKIGFFTMEQAPGAMYPRVIELKHHAAARGQLLATFSLRGQGLPI